MKRFKRLGGDDNLGYFTEWEKHTKKGCTLIVKLNTTCTYKFWTALNKANRDVTPDF